MPIRIGISQGTSHPVFDDIVAGIKAGFRAAGYEEGTDVVFDLQNAQGEAGIVQSIAQKFAQGNYDLLMPLGTQSSQALANLVKDTPIVFGAVTDPVSAGLVPSNDAPGANITGTSDITLYKEHLELLKQLVPSVQTVGIVYNPGEANAQFALAQTEARARELGLTVVTAPAHTTAEILAAAQSLTEKADAFYILPDNTVLAGQEALLKVALEKKKPVISVDQSGVELGALATLGTSYIKVGERTAEIAVRVLQGEDPGEIPVLGVTDADLFVNVKTAEAIGVTFSDDMLRAAKEVYGRETEAPQ